MNATRRRLLLLSAALLLISNPPEAKAAAASYGTCPSQCAGNIVLFGWMACHFVGVCDGGSNGNNYGLYNCDGLYQWVQCTAL